MRLQIDSAGVSGASSAYASEVQQNGRSGSVDRSGDSARTDSVGLSGVSKTLQSAQASHSERLARIAQAVQSGTYSVPSSKIAQAMVTGAAR